MNENKRIAVNTLFLYSRFIITTVINLVASPIILKALGTSDYGLYGVVGGIVAMLNTLATSMVATSYRYMAVELGKGENGNPNKTYNTLVVVHIALAAILLILGETFGVFYVNNYLNIDPAKIPDALFVLHMSLITTAFTVMTIPMKGLIISREKFSFTSTIEIVSSLLKLLFVILLASHDGNRLRFYTATLAFIHFLEPLVYQINCRIKENKIVKWNFNKCGKDYKDLFSFTIWIFLGSVAYVGKIQGAALIINWFFGTILNAAFSLASQVNHAVSSFTSTLRQAAVPQIMKSQSGGREERAMTLVYAISRLSYLSMNIIAIPLLLTIDKVLEIWLGTAPEYTRIFIIFMVINGMVSNLGAGFDANIQATGKIRKNQIGYSIINLSLLPLMYVLYKLGFPPYINVICMVILTLAILIFQISVMNELTSFNIARYLKLTIRPSIFSTIVALAPLLLLKLIWPTSTIATLIFFIIAMIWTCISIAFAGLRREEKSKIIGTIKNKLIKKDYE